MKKALKWTGLILLTPVVLLLVAAALLYVPPIQQWVAEKVAAIASEKTGLDISVGHVSLKFPLDLAADDVLVVRPESDTIAQVGRAVVDVQLWPLLRSQVVVDELSMERAHFNTCDLISDVQVSGQADHLSLRSDGIDLAAGIVNLNDAKLSDADVTIALSDTAAVDTTTSEPLAWLINLDKLNIERTRVSLSMPGDSMRVSGYLGKATATDARIDLADSHYALKELDWQDGQLKYDLPHEPAKAHGLDYSHLDLHDIGLKLDSIDYSGDRLALNLAKASLREANSGLQIDDLHGPVLLDGQRLSLQGLSLTTPHSTIYARADVDLNVMDDVAPGSMDVDLDAQIGRQDLLAFMDDVPAPMRSRWPDWPLSVKGRIKGNLQQARVEQLSMELPTVFRAEASGTINNLTSLDSMLGGLDVKLQTYDLSMLRQTMGLPPSVRIPSGIQLEGKVDANGSRYTADLTAREGRGNIRLKGYYDQKAAVYSADAKINNLNLHHFLPQDSLYELTADVQLRGQGTDFFDSRSRLDAQAQVSHLRYGRLNLDNLHADATLNNGHVLASLTSDNPLMRGTIDADALLGHRSNIKATLGTDVRHADLQALGISSNPLVVGMCGHIDLATDLDEYYQAEGHFADLYIRDSSATYRPQDVTLNLLANRDTTTARLQSGNLALKMDASGGYQRLINQLTALADTIGSQFDQRIIDQPRIKSMLPTMRLYATSGNDNPIADMLRASAGIDFRDLLVDLTASPEKGLNGTAHVYALKYDSVRIDTVHISLRDSEHGLTYQGVVANNRRNPQFVFRALVDGNVYDRGARLGLRFYDDKGDLGVRLGAQAVMEADGLRFQLLPKRPTLGYTEFNLNDDNFLFLGRDAKLQAKVDLVADDGTGIKIYSENQDSTLLQDLTISLHRFDLDRLTTVLPYVPRIAGMLDGDFHLMMNSDRQISVASDMQVRSMAYEGSQMGDVSTEFVYLQREDNTHAVEGILMLSDKEVGALRGEYRDEDDGYLDATLQLTHTPLSLINGFIPDQLIGFEGYAEGEVSVKGSLSQPDAQGELYLDSAYLVSQPYGVRLRFDNDPVRIIDSKLLLENFTMYAYNDNPLNIMGNIDFHDMDHMTMDLRMRARNFQLINSKQSARSIAFGKGFVNFFDTLRGPMERLAMRGKLDVLGNTDLTYLLLDSPLSTDNQLDELVKFTDFNDSVHVSIERPTPDGLTVDLQIGIDQGAHVVCGLNADQTNYVDLFGGGDLRMRYSASELTLNGRYTLNSGEMKYSLPIIPLKTFTIQDGSYVEFTGDPMNPRLNLTATERTKASVGQEGGQSRSVAFDCGVIITKTLNDMGLEFIIDAPEDMSISSELNSMSTEQRGKLAVTMLTTGMYLADGNTSGFSMNSALSSFLQSEINNITGNALKTLDLSIGLDNTTDASGAMHTDYSFKFAKRFWNNRLRVQIGGKVSTGQEAAIGQNQSFFDNVTMEYRLSPTANQYVKLFYNQNAYDWLEGYTGEYGAGFIWKRKMDSFWDIFRFWKKEQPMMIPQRQAKREQADSVKTDTTQTNKEQ